MAKFKIGDKVKVKGSTQIGTISRINTNFGFDYYWIDGLSDGKNPPIYGESLLSLANSSTNPVVQNAMAGKVMKNDMNDYRRLVGGSKKYLPLLKQARQMIQNMSRELGDDATFVTYGNDDNAIKAIDKLIEWCKETSRMSPSDFDF